MRIEPLRHSNFQGIILLAILAALVGAPLVGVLAARDVLTDKIAFVACAAAFGLWVLWQGEKSYWLLFCVGVATITIGHHSIYINPSTYVVALQWIVWILAGLVIANKIIRGEKLEARLPTLLLFVTIWAVLRAIATLFLTDAPDGVVSWSSTFTFGLPSFFIVQHVVRHRTQLIQILRILIGVALAMSVLAIIEYYVPAASQLLPDFFKRTSFLAQDGFPRAEFSFWGNPVGASIILWGMLIAYDELTHSPRRMWQAIALATLGLGAVAVFISGQRSAWIALVIAMIILNLRPTRWTWLLAGAGVIVILILPDTFWNRLTTVTDLALYGNVEDTSTQSRLNRWQSAIDNISANPLTGIGYGSWLIHDAFLEVGNRLGLIPAVVFAVFYVQLLVRVFRTGSRADGQRAPPEVRRYRLLFIALAIPWTIQILIETALETPQFAAAQWVALALAWYLPDILRADEPSLAEAAPPPRIASRSESF